MNPISSHSGASLPLMPPPKKRPDSGPVEQPAADSGKADKQALPEHEVRSGQANLQRFLATHGKAGGGKEIQPGAEEEAGNHDAGEPPQSSHAHAAKPHAAENPGMRRRASRVEKGTSAAQTGGASEASRQGQRRNADANLTLGKVVWGTLKVMTGMFALSAGYRFVRNPGDFVSHPGSTLAGALTFSERVDEQTLHKANQAVLERFGSYIPADSRCHKVRAEVSFDMPTWMAAGRYNAKSNVLGLRPYQQLKGGLATAIHEYCHCFSHPKFGKALGQSPQRTEIDESLTEHIKDKIPAHGRLSPLMSKIDSGYHEMKLSNGKNLVKAAEELENAVGEPTLMRAYFGGDEHAIRKVSRAAVDVFPKRVTLSAWEAIGKLAGNGDKSHKQKLAECFVGASLLAEGKLPPYINGLSYASEHLSVYDFSQINTKQQKEILDQAKQARERLGPKFDQAFFNFDDKAAKVAMKAIQDDLRANWKCVLPEQKSYF